MLLHNYNHLAGTVQYWDTSDSAHRYQENLNNPVNKKLLEKYNFVDAVIEYRFNNDGFRGQEIDNSECLCFGCSFTMGTGIHEESTWPAQLSKIINASVANLGHAGSSNDSALRFALHYVPKLKPKIAVWLQTDMFRLEIIDEHARIVDNVIINHLKNSPYQNDYFIKQWSLNEINQQLNLLKNTLAFKQICQENNTKCIIVSRDDVLHLDMARDLMHPGRESNKKLAESIAQLV
jgi:hypothetical protein